MEIYVLTLDMYYEWSIENGASDILGVFDCKEKATRELLKYIHAEIKDGRCFDDKIEDIKEDIDVYNNNDENSIYFNVYENSYDYDSGKNMGTFKIEKRILNNSGIIL